MNKIATKYSISAGKVVISVQQLSSLLGISYGTLRSHLCCLEKYRVPYTRLLTYRYNYAFLADLRQYYIGRLQSIGKKSRYYEKVVDKIDSLLKLLG